MIKEDIVKIIHERHGGRAYKDVARLVDLLLDTMKSSLAEDGKLLISGFGKFEVKERAKRRIADPNSGEHLVIPERRALTFKASPLLFKKINK